MKSVIVGKPKRIIEESRDGVKLLMEHTFTRPITLPKGVPPLPTTPTPYVVYVNGKQWRKAKEALNDPQDTLIFEGFLAYDREQRTMVMCCVTCNSLKQYHLIKDQNRQKRLKAEIASLSAPKPAEQPATKESATT